MLEFLIGLNKDLDEVRRRILRKEPLTSTQEVFAKIKREENRRKVMMEDGRDSVTTSLKTEGSTMASSGLCELKLWKRRSMDNWKRRKNLV